MRLTACACLVEHLSLTVLSRAYVRLPLSAVVSAEPLRRRLARWTCRGRASAGRCGRVARGAGAGVLAARARCTGRPWCRSTSAALAGCSARRRTSADELQRAAADRGLQLQVDDRADADGRDAAGAGARPACTVAPPGGERAAVAPESPLGRSVRRLPVANATRWPLPLGVLRRLPTRGDGDRLARMRDEVVALLRRWGLKTLGDLAGLPVAAAVGAAGAGTA